MTELSWDPISPELRIDPYPLWKRLRDEAPVYRNDEYDFYALSRFHDIEAAHRDAETFSSGHGTTLETMSPEPIDTAMIIWHDAPKHTTLRKRYLACAGQAVAEVKPSRKVRTSQGRVVERSTRGNPRESATETHRRWSRPT